MQCGYPRSSRSELLQAAALFEKHLGDIDSDAAYGLYSSVAYLQAHRARIIEQICIENMLLKPINLGKSAVMLIGAWPGITALILRKRGLNVTVLDHPSVLSDSIRQIYKSVGVRLCELDLKDVHTVKDLPVFNGGYALIECCECIEHWSFNPLTAIKIFLESLARDGHLYITVPNAVSLYRRLTVLSGRNPYPSMHDFSLQLDSENRCAVAPHWREYTRTDLMECIRLAGGRVSESWFQFHPRLDKLGFHRILYDIVQKAVPFVRDNIGAIVSKSNQ